jgi:hypothetical protein
LVQFGDGTYDEDRAIEKLFRCVPEKYKQMARGVESLIGLSIMTIEEAISRLKVVDANEPQPSWGPVTIGERLHFAGKQWEVYRGDGEKGEPSSATKGHNRGKPRKAGKQAVGKPKPTPDNACRNCGKLGHWAKECRQPRRGQAHVAQADEDEPALLLAHASIELPPEASAVAALLHLDEPKAHTPLGDDKTDEWCLDTGATHHMTGRREFFTELDSSIQGSIKFGDASGVEIKGIGSVICPPSPVSTGYLLESTTSRR